MTKKWRSHQGTLPKCLFVLSVALVLASILGPYRQAAMIQTQQSGLGKKLDSPLMNDTKDGPIEFGMGDTIYHNERAVGNLTFLTANGNLSEDKNRKNPPLVFGQNQTSICTNIPRVLYGIFSINSTDEHSRRRLIRKTYLSSYKIFADMGLPQGPYNRICPLTELLQVQQAYSDSDSLKECWFIYTFVIGAWDASNTSAPTELLDDQASYIHHGSLVSVGEQASRDPETDVTLLNIRENMNEGKTLTWFKYASSVLPETLNIDLIVKVDTDTVVYPHSFLDEFHDEMKKKQVQRPASGVYGGLREVAATGFSVNVIPYYMQGGFYFLSRDLAQDVTSNSCQRSAIIKRQQTATGYRAEDRELGTFVIHCASRTVSRIVLPFWTAKHHWRHKMDSNFRVAWKDALAKDIARLRYKDVQATYTSGCPPSQEALSKELLWFEARQFMKQAKHQFSKLISKECNEFGS